MNDFIFEIKVELKAIAKDGRVFAAYGSLPIEGDLQSHIEMAGRAAAVQAYFFLIRMKEPKSC